MSRYDEHLDPRLVREEVRHFKQHLMSYALVVGMLAMINMLTGGFWSGNLWFLWVAFFWGIGLGFHAINLFGDDIGRGWEERMVDHILSRQRGQSAPAGAPSSTSYTPPAPPTPPASTAPAAYTPPPAPTASAPTPPVPSAAPPSDAAAPAAPEPAAEPSETIYVPPEPPQA